MVRSLIILTQKMYQRVIQPADSVRHHLNECLAECFQQLRGKTLLQEDKVFIVLSFLSDNFNVLLASLESLKTKWLTAICD